MTSELTKMKHKRTAKKNIVLNNIFLSCEEVQLKERSEAALEEAAVLRRALEDAAQEVKQLEENVSDLLEDDAEYQENEEKLYKFSLEVKKMDWKLATFLSSRQQMAMNMKKEENGGETEVKSNKVGVKLPKIKIKPFDGEAMEWTAFIEAFDAMIDIRTDISLIEKFTYLRGFLTGSALQTIQGMPLTQDNYKNAKEMLERRYRNHQLIISSHMNALLKLDKVHTANSKELRELYDKVEINTRALSCAITSEHYWCLLSWKSY